MRCKPFLLALAVAAGLAAIAAAGSARAQQATFDCVIDPAVVVKVGSPVIGLLAEVTVERGDEVSKGDVLARLESEVEMATIALTAERAEADETIAARRAQLTYVRKQLERARKLHEKKVVSSQVMDERTADVEVTKRNLAQAKLQRRLAQLELERARKILEQRTIRSPIDGVVTARLLSGGEFVHQEAYVATIAKLDPLHVEAFLPVEVYKSVERGMQATVHPDEPIGGQYQATVSVVDRVFDSASGTFGVRLELPNPGNRLPGGQRCSVTFPFPASGQTWGAAGLPAHGPPRHGPPRHVAAAG